MFKEQLHESFDAISPSPELLDRISAMMSEEVARPKPSIKMTAVKYGGIAAALALAAGGTIFVLNNANNGIGTTNKTSEAAMAETVAAGAAMDETDGASEAAPAVYGTETTAGAAAEEAAEAEAYSANDIDADIRSFAADIAEETESVNQMKIASDDVSLFSVTTTAAAETTIAATTTAPSAGDNDEDAAQIVKENDEEFDECAECAEDAYMLDDEPAVPAYDNDAAPIANAVTGSITPESGTDSGGLAGLTDRKIVIEGKLCSVLSLTPVDAIVWDGKKYVSLHSGKEPEYTRLISKDNLIGSITRVDGEPKNDLETDFYLDAELYSADGLRFLVAKANDLLLQDELKNADLPKIKGVESFTTDNVLLVFPIYEYEDSGFIGSDTFNRYKS